MSKSICSAHLTCLIFKTFSCHREVFKIFSETRVCPDCTARTTLSFLRAWSRGSSPRLSTEKFYPLSSHRRITRIARARGIVGASPTYLRCYIDFLLLRRLPQLTELALSTSLHSTRVRSRTYAPTALLFSSLDYRGRALPHTSGAVYPDLILRSPDRPFFVSPCSPIHFAHVENDKSTGKYTRWPRYRAHSI